MTNSNSNSTSNSTPNSTSPAKKRRRRRRGKGRLNTSPPANHTSARQANVGMSSSSPSPTGAPLSLESDALSLLLGTLRGLSNNVEKLAERLEEVEHRVNNPQLQQYPLSPSTLPQGLQSPSPHEQPPARGLSSMGLGGGAAEGSDDPDYDPVLEQNRNQRRIASINEELAKIDRQENMVGTERVIVVGRGARARDYSGEF